MAFTLLPSHPQAFPLVCWRKKGKWMFLYHSQHIIPGSGIQKPLQEISLAGFYDSVTHERSRTTTQIDLIILMRRFTDEENSQSCVELLGNGAQRKSQFRTFMEPKKEASCPGPHGTHLPRCFFNFPYSAPTEIRESLPSIPCSISIKFYANSLLASDIILCDAVMLLRRQVFSWSLYMLFQHLWKLHLPSLKSLSTQSQDCPSPSPEQSYSLSQKGPASGLNLVKLPSLNLFQIYKSWATLLFVATQRDTSNFVVLLAQ